MIATIFQIINFGIFTALIIYLVRKHLVPMLREALVKQHREMVALHTEHDQLASDQKNLETSIAQQEDEAMTLFKKINRWRNEVATKRKKRKREDKQLLEQAHAKAREQLDNYALRRTYTEVVPLVVERLKGELTQTFEDDAEGHKYIANMLEKL